MGVPWERLSADTQASLIKPILDNMDKFSSQGLSNTLYGMMKMGCKYEGLSSAFLDSLSSGTANDDTINS